MNIYIYGNNGFKKDIHQTLEHANIKFKLDENSEVKDIDNLDELKAAIVNNPNDIYLIDDEKIIKKNKLSQKIKFLAPKDGIEEDFLLDNGIADLSVDSLNEIPKYIIKKHDQQKALENDDIQNSIIDIVDEAYSEDESSYDFELDDELAKLLASDGSDSSNDNEVKIEEIQESTSSLFEKEETNNSLDSMGDIDNLLDNTDIETSSNVNLDAMDALLSDIPDEDEEKELSKEELNSIINFDEDVGLSNVSTDYDDADTLQEDEKNIEDEIESLDSNALDDEDFLKELGNIENINIHEEQKDEEDDFSVLNDIEDLEIKNDKILEVTKGDTMADEFSELESLNEEDILEALNGFENVKAIKSGAPVPSNNTANEKVSLESSNVDDLAGLISKLLNNKTLEITIKIKD